MYTQLRRQSSSALHMQEHKTMQNQYTYVCENYLCYRNDYMLQKWSLDAEVYKWNNRQMHWMNRRMNMSGQISKLYVDKCMSCVSVLQTQVGKRTKTPTKQITEKVKKVVSKIGRMPNHLSWTQNLADGMLKPCIFDVHAHSY